MGKTLLAGVIAAAAAWGQPAAKNPFAASREAAEAGRGMFRISCSPCHGIQAGGGRGPDLTRGTFSAGDTDADLYRVIDEGVPGTEMPAFGARFSAENVWRLVTYIRSAAQAGGPVKVTGDPASGEKLFWGKGSCGQCHRVGLKGGRLGPELTRIGRLRSLAYLRTAVLNPNADLTPGYATVTVVTRDGRKITGVQKGFDNFTAQLLDFSEKFHSFDKSDVRSATREFKSVMPSYEQTFTPAEVDHLIAYLVSLRGDK